MSYWKLRHGADDVQDTFLWSLGNDHLLMIDRDPLSPFKIVCEQTAEDRDKAIPRGGVVKTTRRRRASCRRACHRALPKGSPRRIQEPPQLGLDAVGAVVVVEQVVHHQRKVVALPKESGSATNVKLV